jgi:hypothetical protein
MKNLWLASTLLAPIVLFTNPAHASERVVPCSTLPSAVQQKGNSLLDGATIHACQKDVTKGVITYEMELIKDGRSRDITFDPSGNIVESEDQIDLDALPAPVKAAILKAAAGTHPGKIESLTRNGQIISYETTVVKAGKHKEIAFHPDGSSMQPD